jgi:arsenate reductase (glutaredoxin)
MKATIWHNPDCGTSRKTLAILQETPGVDVTIVEYRKIPFIRDKLVQLFSDAGLTPRF